VIADSFDFYHVFTFPVILSIAPYGSLVQYSPCSFTHCRFRFVWPFLPRCLLVLFFIEYFARNPAVQGGEAERRATRG
jgi:hypothetical protein